MLISNDVHDVALRLKEIDPGYELHYESSDRKFRLKNAEGDTLIVFPFRSIDCRMVEHARKTRVERLEEIIKEIDKANAAAEESAIRRKESLASDSLKEAASRYYADKNRKGTR